MIFPYILLVESSLQQVTVYKSRKYLQTSEVSRTLVSNKIADHSDVSPLLQLHIPSWLNTWLQ